jgi:pimeloyl-ACP methyl ester carboxylesterase
MLRRIFYKWEKKLSERDTNRVVRPFEWGLDFITKNQPEDDPKTFLFEYAERAVRESDRHYALKPVADYRLDGRHLTFTSPLQTICPVNNTVHGWFFPKDPRRAVLVLPQWNANAQSHMSLCRMLNAFGVSALRLSLPYHDLRMPEELTRADYMLSSNLGRTLQSVRQAVLDARAAIDWLQARGFTRIAVLGTSIGSCVALITAAHDARINVAIQNHVSSYFADVVWRGISTRHVLGGLRDNITLDDLRKIWMPISPQAYFHKLQGTEKKSLLVHARYDYTFLPDLSVKVLEEYRRLGLPHSTFGLYCGHYTSGIFPFNVVLGTAMCRYISGNL